MLRSYVKGRGSCATPTLAMPGGISMSSSSLWIFLSFLFGVTLGTAIGWKAHSKRNSWLKERRDFYKSKAAEAQERLESS